MAEHYTSKLSGHKQEVCGLKWSFDGQQLASGGNDNKLYIWSPHSNVPLLRFNEHTAAVKAISWSPHQNGLLASGGGTADRCIRFWNTQTASALNCVDTGSQVCNLCWSKNINELVSTHGYSQNQIVVWRYSSMSKVWDEPTPISAATDRPSAPPPNGHLSSPGCRPPALPPPRSSSTRPPVPRRRTSRLPLPKVATWTGHTLPLPLTPAQVATLTGHTLRVLYLAMSPDGQTIVTGAGDETLRFWNVFPGPKTKGDASHATSMLDFQGRTAIR